MFRLSFSGKIVILILITVVVVGGATFGASYYFFFKAFDEQAEQRIGLTSMGVQGTVDDLMDRMKKLAVSFASRPDLAEAVEKKDAKRLQAIGKEITALNGLDVLTVADPEGKVLARGHSDKTGDSVANQLNVKKAQAGEATSGIEEGTVVKFSLRAGAPIKVNGRVVGTITPGISLTGTSGFVDGMKQRYHVECTIFKGDERVATTLEKDGKRLVGTKMDNPAIIETVLHKGQKFLTTNTIEGKVYNTAYWPIVGADGKITGMLFIGIERNLIEKAGDTVLKAVLLTVLGIAIFMVCAGYFLTRSLVNPLLASMRLIDRGVHEVSAVAGEVASSSQQLAEGASAQAASIEETSSSLEQMSSMTKQNADNAHQADQLMANTKMSVSRSAQIMEKLTSSMGEISRASEETSKIIKTIDEIAFQTNLLALNAAVEAARAGEAGAGFAVVADEVRNLAMRAAEAAKSTANLIEGTVKKVKDGSELVGSTEKEFHEVAANVDRSGELVGEISAASVEQAQGIEQINRAVSEMDKVVQRNASTAEESASAVREMSVRANQMSERVNTLLRLVGGSRTAATEKAVPVSAKKPVPVAAVPAPMPSGPRKAPAIPVKKETRAEQVIPFNETNLSDF